MMKKLTILFLFSVILIKANAQFPFNTTVNNNATRYYIKGGTAIDSTLIFAVAYSDTANANFGWIKNIPGAVIRTSNNKLWLRNNVVTAWIEIGSGGGGSSSKFGKSGEDDVAAENRSFNFKRSYSQTYDSVKNIYWRNRATNESYFQFDGINNVIDAYVANNANTFSGNFYALSDNTSGEAGLATSGGYGNMYTDFVSEATFQRHQVGNYFNKDGIWVDQRLEMYNDHTNAGTHWEVYREKWVDPTSALNFLSGKISIDSKGVSLKTTKSLLGANYKGLLVDSNSNIRFENYPYSRNDGGFPQRVLYMGSDSVVKNGYLDTTFYQTKAATKKSIDSVLAVAGGGFSNGNKTDVTIFNSGDSIRINDGVVIPEKLSNSYDRQRGSQYSSIYSKTSFEALDLDTFDLAGVTPTVSGDKILMGDQSTNVALLKFKNATSNDRWTIEDEFVLGQEDGNSYGHAFYFEALQFPVNFFAFLEHRSTTGYDGVLSFNVFNGVTTTRIAQAASKLVMSVGDSIFFRLTRDVNVFTSTAINLSTGTSVEVSYVYTGHTTAVPTAIPQIQVVGSDSIYRISFYSNQSVGVSVATGGDSKFTWYGGLPSMSIPMQLYGRAGNVINFGKSGDNTAQAVETLDEVIAHKPDNYLSDIGNDLRNGVATATWKRNIDTIYNKLTRNGIEVWFDLMWETDVDQTPYIDYITANYPTRANFAGYYATKKCGAPCLDVDGIHQTDYGKKVWVDAVLQSGLIDFNSPKRKMLFKAGNPDFIEIGGNRIVSKFFNENIWDLDIWRDGEKQWPLADDEDGNGFKVFGDTVEFVPTVDTLERFEINATRKMQVVTIPNPEIQPTPFEGLLDIVPSAARAYSVRRLSESYTGKLLRVRRSNDDAEMDIGYNLGNELDTATMKTFVSSNSAYVVTWYDQSGNGANATQATSANQPRIMNAGVIDRLQNNDGGWNVAIKFDGSNDYLGFTDLAFPVTYSQFMVQKRVSSGAFGMVLTGDPYTGHFQQYNDDNLYIARNSGAGIYKTAADATATYCLLSGFAVGSSLTAYKNSSAYSLSGDNTAFGYNGQWNRIGVFASSNYSNAYVSSIILYTSDQTSNRTVIEANINSFFKLY